ncbi:MULTISPECIES: hypothetical protein [Microcystis]|uniref:hypothetical protein n=1 Tax=Microcystis TaxID=1125 RepID=UPI0012BAC052|nr:MULTISPECIES: hypothetical protein [Microcystis]
MTDKFRNVLHFITVRPRRRGCQLGRFLLYHCTRFIEVVDGPAARMSIGSISPPENLLVLR